MTEHREVWHWSTGETASLPFASVMRVEGDVIALWKDYWDYTTLMQAAFRRRFERIKAALEPWSDDDRRRLQDLLTRLATDLATANDRDVSELDGPRTRTDMPPAPILDRPTP